MIPYLNCNHRHLRFTVSSYIQHRLTYLNGNSQTSKISSQISKYQIIHSPILIAQILEPTLVYPSQLWLSLAYLQGKGDNSCAPKSYSQVIKQYSSILAPNTSLPQSVLYSPGFRQLIITCNNLSQSNLVYSCLLYLPPPTLASRHRLPQLPCLPLLFQTCSRTFLPTVAYPVYPSLDDLSLPLVTVYYHLLPQHNLAYQGTK